MFNYVPHHENLPYA